MSRPKAFALVFIIFLTINATFYGAYWLGSHLYGS